MLKEFLYDKAKSILFTSATLSIQSSFDFFKNELGLTDYHLVEKIYSSPSEFKEGVTVLIPTDLEGIKELTGEEYAKQTGDYIFKIASKVNGRTLVLFTAYDLLKKTYEEVKMHQTEEKSLNLIGQGFSQGGKQRLIKQFLQTKQSILFGTNTFWEGIDLPNDELDCVIIVRLPFTSPEKPMYIAKSRLLKNEGKNSFAELALPLAIMKFKQGYGRLIRNEEDRGYFVILDNRITNSTYGSKFIEVLPNQNIIIDCLENLLGKIDGRSLVE
jgi:ATP-dependent DNA helicase DinG